MSRDPGAMLSEDQLRQELRAEVRRAGSAKALAREIGATPPMISDFLRRRRFPCPAIRAFLGVEPRIVFVRKEHRSCET